MAAGRVEPISRWIEIIAALLASALGLIWLASEATNLQSLWALGALSGSGAGHSPQQPIGANGTGLYFAVTGALIICVSVGAYLHVIRQMPSGLILVWVAAVAASAALGYYLIEPWRIVPIQFIYIAQEAASAWLTPVGVLSLVFAWIAAVAGLPIRREMGSPAESADPRRGQQGREPLPAP